ncbi:hypothetical protein OAF87_03775, partial [Akkermansiaceae bacterium]|nr:hypothetical protein [Akkermansiaceae bacterium]
MIRESLLVSFLLVPLLGAQEPAKQWSQFRGPDAKGIIKTEPTPTKWNVETGENILWKTPIPGTAHSAPIIWDERIYLTTVVSPTEAELKIGLYGDISSANDVGIHNWRLLAIDRATGK